MTRLLWCIIDVQLGTGKTVGHMEGVLSAAQNKPFATQWSLYLPPIKYVNTQTGSATVAKEEISLYSTHLHSVTSSIKIIPGCSKSFALPFA